MLDIMGVLLVRCVDTICSGDIAYAERARRGNHLKFLNDNIIYKHINIIVTMLYISSTVTVQQKRERRHSVHDGVVSEQPVNFMLTTSKRI